MHGPTDMTRASGALTEALAWELEISAEPSKPARSRLFVPDC